MANILRKVKPHHRIVTAFVTSAIFLLCLYFENFGIRFKDNSYHSFETAAESVTLASHTNAHSRMRIVDWFDARYATTVHLLLNSTNSLLRADVWRWWTGLQIVTRVANYNVVVRRLFPFFPDRERPDIHPNRSRTCAVVGNSGNLLGSHYGRLIDSNDFVMRINKGPTEDFEDDVGTKTTHRILYPESAMDLDNSTHMVFFPFKIVDIEWLIGAFTTQHVMKTYIEVPFTIKANKDKVMILHPEFIKYVYENWTEYHGRYPSTGFLTVIFALHICDEVNVFGFGATKDGNWHHYFDQTLVPYVNESHAGDFEYETILRLHMEKKIMMFKGWT